MRKHLFPLLALSIVSLSANATCFQQASERYRISENLLRAMAEQESSYNPRAINRRSATDEDVGFMQISSWWFPRLKQYGITRQKLLDDPCLNLNVGAWILATNFHTHGRNWNSVGAYNAGFKPENEAARQEYIGLIKGRLAAIKKRRRSAAPEVSQTKSRSLAGRSPS